MARENERPARDNAGRRDDSDRNRSDRPNNDREGKKIFNRRDKNDRPEGGEERGERRSFNSDRRNNDRRDNREGGERRSFGDRREGGERGDRRSFGSDRKEGGERRPFNSDRPRREDGERRSFGNDRREGGERRSFGGDRREGGENRERRPSEGNRVKRYDRDNNGGERKPFNADRPDRRDDRRGDRNEGGERRSFNSDRPRREDGERKSFSRDNREGGERRSFSNDRPRRDDGDRKQFRESREDRLGKQAPTRFNDRKGDAEEAPNYNLSRYKDNPRIKKTNRKEDEDGTIRLNRFIANAGVCSRREADTLIESGEIKVNGEVITEMGYKVQPTDNVQYGKKILNREKMVYVLLNKPKDFITTTEDPEGRKTVMDLVATASKERIFPVGRLDRNTTGLLLFTNDGELAQKLTHPSNNIRKIYQVELDKPITKADFQKIAEGVELEDGKAEVDDVALLGDSNQFLGVEIHIGRNRIVRRIFEHLGYDVVSLDRVQYAGLTKKDVPRGNWRFLTEKEVIRLKYFM
ncbi:pseudouridine synthase [uncultured Pontibacter sp.]|uniref:pseudouridine synthase n=1 Tax=uncultured Pontibacter sp. TaxID=453356 RepID=UPI002630B836|nr:pseudouridine synthase [uncultured Pontibacter sp.]